ncbi:hypothetical protein Aph02nite_41830 [Actinoplanes philippinensis]|uniref:Uncharacterized protein n=1 Tax=Actinoplanes philippinensis TaxID=35752 RepID=A0A1I2GZR4_9ACTN|nr:hypothetical protein [Actinoplanes philippinensis]GIE78233.1 hypothetical protein Aph02nite_41830 [Actinoplanes philippinensis]SFF22633.1 hypothetical protein SAMN05421541_107311 [Actinoplanes philippinensis]
MSERSYGRRDLIDAFLATREGERYGGYHPESSAYNAALRAHHEAMFGVLQRLFEVSLTGEAAPDRVLFMLFQSTARSLLALTTPWSGFLEAGLLHRRLEATGDPGARVMAASDRIWSRNDESREDHLLILDELLTVFLGDRAGRTFTAADLIAAGTDPTPPSTADHPLYED